MNCNLAVNQTLFSMAMQQATKGCKLCSMDTQQYTSPQPCPFLASLTVNRASLNLIRSSRRHMICLKVDPHHDLYAGSGRQKEIRAEATYPAALASGDICYSTS